MYANRSQHTCVQMPTKGLLKVDITWTLFYCMLKRFCYCQPIVKQKTLPNSAKQTLEEKSQQMDIKCYERKLWRLPNSSMFYPANQNGVDI